MPTILGELRRYFRDSSWGIHVPRDLQEQALKVGGAQEELAKEHGRAPTVNELAVYLELDTERVLEALQAAQAYEALPLDAPAGSADGDEGITYLDSLGSEDEHYELVELDATVATALKSLPPASGRSCACASSRNSARPRSAGVSASPRCRSRVYCAVRSRSCVSSPTPRPGLPGSQATGRQRGASKHPNRVRSWQSIRCRPTSQMSA